MKCHQKMSDVRFSCSHNEFLVHTWSSRRSRGKPRWFRGKWPKIGQKAVMNYRTPNYFFSFSAGLPPSTSM
jgi:hypothetical protein